MTPLSRPSRFELAEKGYPRLESYGAPTTAPDPHFFSAARMYTAEQVSSAPGSNTEFHPARRVIRWKELKGMQYLADGAMCSCYTAQLAGHGTVVVKKPSRRSSEVSRSLVVEHAVVGVRRRDVPCAVVPQLHATGLVNNMVHFFPPTARSQISSLFVQVDVGGGSRGVCPLGFFAQVRGARPVRQLHA